MRLPLRKSPPARHTLTMIAPQLGTGGGTEAQTARLAEGLARLGWDVTVIARRCEVPGVRWVRIRGPARPAALAFPWFFVAGSVAALLRRGGIVHSTGAVSAARTDALTVHFCHTAYLSGGHPSRAQRQDALHRANAWIAERLGSLAEALCYRPRKARTLIAVSGGVADELRKHFPTMSPSVRVVPNGVDRAKFRPDEAVRARIRARLGLGDEELVALFVGGDWARKGLDLAVEALARAPQWRLLIVGGGDANALARLAARHGVAERVVQVGAVSEPESYYAAADAFVLPSAYETFSLVAYEAAASGLPLVATRVSGIEDILRDGETGFEVKRDSAAIAAKLRLVGADPILRGVLGEAARASTAGYGWDDAISAYHRLFSELEASTATSPPR